MTEIMTYQNILIGGIAVSAVRFVVWKFWSQPRRIAQLRKMIREEISGAGLVHS